ncbi:NUDIX domain-containing protein [Microbacterium schleiferi]|uniref:NUDIX domain-containing protein n=1 Tax=Microbacterium schleiferi TaxID=69362 RepID=A0A7S8RHG8_9MICO|nr:NUDIX domain-containing protein [Microbacterium schleiferi]QPE04341.1 NUDIX domain-containing protein [Microbacterium schleiferi]
MPVTSAGLLAYRPTADDAARFEVLIAHMGGPFWQRKDAGAWTIPKGEYNAAEESPLEAARREFREELGIDPPDGPVIDLGSFAASRKSITVFAVDGSALDISRPVFGEFELEWPPRSGRMASFPEVDRIAWMPLDVAAAKLTASQRPALTSLAAVPGGRGVS